MDEAEIDDIILDENPNNEDSESKFVRLEKFSAVAFTKWVIRKRHEDSK